MNWKKFSKHLLFPPVPILLALLPVATVLTVYSMVFIGTESVLAYVSYALAAYTLTVWCARVPWLIRFFKAFSHDNRYANRWFTDTRLRVKVSLYATFLWNVIYAVFQMGLGFLHASFWYGSLAGYYLALALMRFYLARHTSHFRPGEKMREELRKYRVCGWIFLLLNLILTVIIFFMVYWNRTFLHHEITTIAMAAYTFTALAAAIVGIVRYGKYNSPVYSASKAISLAAACVSMLTLESTMLTTFGEGTVDLATRRIFLGVSGGVVSAFILAMAIRMIAQGAKKAKELNHGES